MNIEIGQVNPANPKDNYAATSGSLNITNGLITQNPPRCECHECTQARWKSSMMGQMQGNR